jgi:hypothetical protein
LGPWPLVPQVRWAHAGAMTMDLHLSSTEASELSDLLDGTIADLSPEIAATDNPEYRAMLRGRRESFQAIRGKLNGAGTA